MELRLRFHISVVLKMDHMSACRGVYLDNAMRLSYSEILQTIRQPYTRTGCTRGFQHKDTSNTNCIPILVYYSTCKCEIYRLFLTDSIFLWRQQTHKAETVCIFSHSYNVQRPRSDVRSSVVQRNMETNYYFAAVHEQNITRKSSEYVREAIRVCGIFNLDARGGAEGI